MSNELKQIVKDIQYFTDKSLEKIGEDIHYSRAYLNDQINKGRNDSLLNLLREKYVDQIKKGVRNSPLFKEVLTEELQRLKGNLGKLPLNVDQPGGLNKEQISASASYSVSGSKEDLRRKRKDNDPGTDKQSRT